MAATASGERARVNRFTMSKQGALVVAAAVLCCAAPRAAAYDVAVRPATYRSPRHRMPCNSSVKARGFKPRVDGVAGNDGA